ncbi:FGGY family carbohydrate kinase [Gracilibacillus sp. YIM 98692]|uniref:FGGY-family carbohydrate kinase n=1 Tax=Gracilibacillus sp. YIM 98692 TaxID=2663532 RepID=UPI0013D18281|nr:FGGY family carbohydrate kinase [Gracilibacillus sp. YIM 98692]
MYSIGIDIGTTHIKVAVVHIQNRSIVTLKKCVTPVIQTDTGYYERNPIEIRDAVYNLLLKCTDELDHHQITSISTASFGEEVVLLDEKNYPIGNSIAWYDHRGISEAKEFNRKNTQYHIDPSFSIFKLLWLQKNRPLDLEKTNKMIDMGGYVLGSLCDQYVMNWSHASRTGLFDIKNKSWNMDLLNRVDISVDVLPDLKPSGVCIGNVSTDIAKKLHVPKNMKVVTGGHDHLCAAYASGVNGEGKLFISAGTSEAHLMLTKKSYDMEELSSQTVMGCFVDEEHYYVMTSLSSGHIFKQWKSFLYKDSDEKELYQEITKVPSGSNGVIFEISEDAEYYTFDHFNHLTTRAEFMRAIMEGISRKAVRMTNSLLELTDTSLKRIIISGHPTKHDIWKSIRAQEYKKGFEIVEEEEPAAYGAALLAQKPMNNHSHQYVEVSVWE